MLLENIHKLLSFVAKSIVKNKKYRSRLDITGNRDHLVGVVEFPNLDALVIFKHLCEYVSSDYTFIHNSKLRQNNSTQWSCNSLEVYTLATTQKVKLFLDFLNQMRHLANIIIAEMRNDWIRMTDFCFAIYFRKNAHRNKEKHGEDVFWRHVLRYLDVPSNTISVHHGTTRDGERWNYIVMMLEDQRFVEKGFGIVPFRDADHKEEIATYYRDFGILQQIIDNKLL